MAIALGGNSINKAYLGTTEIQKMYLGADLVFDNSIQPSELTPIMTNFRILDGIANRVYFDTPLGPVTGLTTQGFTISGVTQITSVNTTDNYFTIATGLNFWDQAMTIRLENGNGVVYDFTMESIYNEMDEPTATTIRYMSADASGSGNGESEVNAWTASQAEGATEGMTVWMKAGDYGAVTNWGPNNDGSANNPIKFIGYKDTIGDITENYLDSYDSGGKGISTDWDVNAFPTFKGSSTIGASTATAISFSSSYIIIRNLQTENYKTTMSGGPDHFVMDNFNSRNNYHSSEVSYHGIFLQNNTTLNNMTFRNLVLLNHSQNTFAIQGTTADFNLYENIRSWNDRTSDTERVDYHITFNGNNNIVRNCYVENFNDNNNGSSHGIGMKTTSSAHANNYNLIELSTAINQQECFYLRNYYCDYNVIKDCIADNNGSTSFNDCGGLWFWGGVHYNIYERCTVKNMNFCGIGLNDNAESPDHDEVGTDNTVRNCIFSNCKMGIYNKTTAASSAFTDNYFYNNIFHNITQQFMYTEPGQGVDITNLQMTNNVIDGCSSQGDALTGFVWDSNNFWQSWSNGLGTNSMNIDPQWVDEIDFVPQNESMIAYRISSIYYDINKVERANPDSTLGASLLESENAGTQPPVTDIDYYVSSTGTGDGLTESNPMSYADAKTQLSSMSPSEVMAFKKGDTFVDGFTMSNISGTSGNEITLTSYGTGDLPVFSGSGEITGWTNTSGDIWEASTGADDVYNVPDYQNARLPDLVGADDLSTNYLYITSVQNVANQFTCSDLSGHSSLVGATVMIRVNPFARRAVTVTADDGLGKLTVTPDLPAYWEYGVGQDFWLQDSYNLLSADGEWYYDSDVNKLFMHSLSQPTSITATVNSGDGITLDNSDYITIDGLNVKDFNTTAIKLDNSDNSTLTNNTIENCGFSGVHVLVSQNSNIDNNTIDNISGKGIVLELGTNTNVINNTINDIYRLKNIQPIVVEDHGGVYVSSHSTNTLVENNIFTNLGFNGVASYQTTSLTVNSNYVENYCLNMEDGGGIYLTNSVGDISPAVTNNIVAGYDSFEDSSWDSQGIYLDDDAHDYTITGNVLIGGRTNFFGHNNQNNTVENNKFYKSREESVLFNNDNIGADASGNELNNNDIYSENSTYLSLKVHNKTDTFYNFLTSNYNNYFNTLDINTVHLKTTSPIDTEYTVVGWNGLTGNDANSTDDTGLTITDSQCVYNATNSQVITPIVGTWRDLSGNNYTDSITLEPWSGEILIQVDGGSNVIKNGTFDDATDWVLSGPVPPTIAGGVLSIVSNGDSCEALQNGVIEIGATYDVEFEATINSGGGVIVLGGNDTAYFDVNDLVGGKIYKTLTNNAASSNSFSIKRSAACDIVIDNVVAIKQ